MLTSRLRTTVAPHNRTGQRPTLALLVRAAYSQHAVQQPFINVEETIDRIVGKRTKAPNGLSTATSCKADSIAWRKAFGGVRVPRGVYRFKTHDEADQSLWRMIARPTS
jgi:hypothetical protein